MSTREAHRYQNTGGNSSVEQAVLRRARAKPVFRPDREKVEALQAVVADPFQQRAMALKTGVFDGKPRSLDEIAQIMKIPKAEAEALVNQGRELLNLALRQGR